jgi:sirohydrochlorin ferrochelatase
LLIAAHGDCGGNGGNVLANELAHRMRMARHYDEVAVGYIRCGPAIEEVAAEIASNRIRLYPLFMSDGYYVRNAIRKRLGLADGVDALGRAVTIDPPLGLHPGLPGQLLSAATAMASRAGVKPGSATLLLVAHGSSKTPHSAEVARQVAQSMATTRAFGAVEVAFLEEAPLFVDALRACARPVFVLGLFAGCGLHADEDIHRMVDEAGDPGIHIIEQLGGYAGVIELVAASLAGD